MYSGKNWQGHIEFMQVMCDSSDIEMLLAEKNKLHF